MNNGIKLFVAFAVGAGFGAMASKLYFKTKYEKIADGEIESMKHHYEKQKVKEDVDRDSKKPVSDDITPLVPKKPRYIPEYGNLLVNEGT